MAATQRIIADSGMDEVRLLREQVNRLTAQLESLLTGLAGVAVIGDVVTVATGVDTAGNVTITVSPEPPTPRRPAAV